MQQLRDGVLNFFLTFIEVRKDLLSSGGRRSEVEEGITSGDYLQGFLRGTRSALYESGRESITISIPEMNAFNIGALIALYERAVGFYASLVNINAYDQPGVEAGKKAATKLLQLQKHVREQLRAGTGKTAEEIARSIDADPKTCFIRCGIWRAMIRAFVSCRATRRLTINSRWQIPIRENSTGLTGAIWQSPLLKNKLIH